MGAVAWRNDSGGALIEDIIRHRLRICGPDATGHVVFMYTPAHCGGVVPNAYADTAAKSYLSEPPAEPELCVKSRLSLQVPAGGP